MSTTVLMPVDEYLRLTEKPYREYREGAVFAKARYTKHSASNRCAPQRRSARVQFRFGVEELFAALDT